MRLERYDNERPDPYVLDTMIAAHALALKVALVTNNQKHFQNVKGLVLENWVA